jgi:hypothetical protein
MIRLVSDNPVPRIPAVDDAVRDTFAVLAAGVLEFLAGNDVTDLSAAAAAFHEACEESKQKIKDPNGVLISHRDFSERGIDDDVINGVLRGALRQVAAFVIDGNSGERYEAARNELTAGIVALNKAANASVKRSRK